MKSITSGIWLSVTSIAAMAVIAACSGSSEVTPNAATASIGSAINATAASQLTVDAQGKKEKKRGRGRFVIQIPRKKKLGRRMHPEYVSPSTQSMTVALQGGATQTFNLTSASSNCTTDKTTGYLTCEESMSIPSGQQTLTVTLYDLQNGLGDQLATATTSVAIAPTGFTTIPITLDGVVSTATVLVNGAQTANIPVGTPTSVPVTVEAYDAQGNLIIPPGNYSSPITLTNNDPSGITSFTSPAPGLRRPDVSTQDTGKGRRFELLDVTTIDAPGSSQMLYYNGGFFATGTITPSVGGTPQPSGAAILTGTGNTITKYSIPTAYSAPLGITTGPDGALWFAENCGNKIGRITTGGTITEYPTPTTNSEPARITAGQDGALWFTENCGNNIGRITTGGTITEYPIPTANSEPTAIISGPDGALWFVEQCTNKIGRITTSGTITEYSYTDPGETRGSPSVLVNGPDGALWIADHYGYIVRMTTSGTVTNFYATTSWAINTLGPDGALWGAAGGEEGVARIPISAPTTSTLYPLPDVSEYTDDMIAGPDGAVWFGSSESSYGMIRITTGGAVTEYSLPSGSDPEVITVGPAPAQALWFTDLGTNSIGVML